MTTEDEEAVAQWQSEAANYREEMQGLIDQLLNSMIDVPSRLMDLAKTKAGAKMLREREQYLTMAAHRIWEVRQMVKGADESVE